MAVDQLARFLGVCVENASEIVGRLEALGWVMSAAFDEDVHRWVWLRQAGLARVGSPVGYRRPRMIGLPKRRAVTEARLVLEAERPEGRWTSRRALLSQSACHERFVPDGVLEVAGERWAIKVQRARKDMSRVRLDVAAFGETYDRVLYFCGDAMAYRLRREQRETGNDRLEVRRLADYEADQPAFPGKWLKVGREPSVAQVNLLVFLSEQRAVRLDQVARYLDLSYAQAKAAVAELVHQEWAVCADVVSGELPWVWLRRPGAEIASTGYSVGKPSLGSLEHLAAITEVRLHLESRAALAWSCERALEGKKGRNAVYPDAVVEIGDERHAIEVELSAKGVDRWQQVISSHLMTYDMVVYFCGPLARRRLLRLKEELGDNRLVIKALPSTIVEEPRRRSGRRYPMVLSDSRDVEFLALIAEQGGLRVDQLARLAARPLAEVEARARDFADKRFVSYVTMVPGEPAWVWIQSAGARRSGTGLGQNDPTHRVLPVLRATNEIRIAVAENRPGARWVSRRHLVTGGRSIGHQPQGVVEVGQERHAIEVCVKARGKCAVKNLVMFSAEYDAVVCFCSSHMVGRTRRLCAKYGWSNVEVRPLPGN